MKQVPLNIMLVDDDDVDVMSLQRAFRQNNLTNPLFVANDGVEALEMLRGTNGRKKIVPTPKIIITDINMPNMNGLEFLKELRADKNLYTSSVFVLTTSNDDKHLIEAHNYNIAGYIIKPINMENFSQAVATLRNYWQLCFNDKIEIKEIDDMDAYSDHVSLN